MFQPEAWQKDLARDCIYSINLGIFLFQNCRIIKKKPKQNQPTILKKFFLSLIWINATGYLICQMHFHYWQVYCMVHYYVFRTYYMHFCHKAWDQNILGPLLCHLKVALLGFCDEKLLWSWQSWEDDSSCSRVFRWQGHQGSLHTNFIALMLWLG